MKFNNKNPINIEEQKIASSEIFENLSLYKTL